MPLKIDDQEMFAIDSHTHMGRRNTPLGHGVASFLGEDLVRDMDELGLDKAVAFPLGAPYTDYSESNATIAAEVAKFPQRIIGFCRINPNFGPQATAKALDRCLGTLKLSGIKLHPEIEFFDPNEEELMEPVYEAARRYHVPIIFHTGMSSKAAPAVIAELVQSTEMFQSSWDTWASPSTSSKQLRWRGKTRIFTWKLPWWDGCH